MQIHNLLFILACSESGGCACTSIWLLLRGSDILPFAVGWLTEELRYEGKDNIFYR